MTGFGTYLISRAMGIIGSLLLAAGLSVYLLLLGNPFWSVMWIDLVWFGVLAGKTGLHYGSLRKKEKKLQEKLRGLDKKYLISEILSAPELPEGKMYYDLLKTACKSMADEVHKANETAADYKEYVEEWIHEIKTPITAIDLICSNHEEESCRRIGRELKKVGALVEQVLYYARSENVEKDYFIREHTLSDLVNPAIGASRTILLEKNIRLAVTELSEKVWTDEKWMTFILNQIFSNAVKYADKPDPRITVSSEKRGNGIALVIEDNGCGIRAEDLPRVFEKGFTGGSRGNKKATGMGLYLGKKLCTRLGHSLWIESKEGAFTKVIIGFPIGRLTEVARDG